MKKEQQDPFHNINIDKLPFDIGMQLLQNKINEAKSNNSIYSNIVYFQNFLLSLTAKLNTKHTSSNSHLHEKSRQDLLETCRKQIYSHITILPPEILTKILEQLPLQDLLRCRKVSHIFSDIVNKLTRSRFDLGLALNSSNHKKFIQYLKYISTKMACGIHIHIKDNPAKRQNQIGHIIYNRLFQDQISKAIPKTSLLDLIHHYLESLQGRYKGIHFFIMGSIGFLITLSLYILRMMKHGTRIMLSDSIHTILFMLVFLYLIFNAMPTITPQQFFHQYYNEQLQNLEANKRIFLQNTDQLYHQLMSTMGNIETGKIQQAEMHLITAIHILTAMTAPVENGQQTSSSHQQT